MGSAVALNTDQRSVERDDRGGWVYEPWPSQQRFNADLSHRFKGFSGPVGSGKSKALAYEVIILARLNPGCMGLLGAPTYKMLRDTTEVQFFNAMETEQISYTHHKAEDAVTFHSNGSKVLFRSVDDPERLRGPNLAWFALDELTYCPEASWLRLEGRIRDPRANRIGGSAVWTPKGFDWVYDRFIGNHDPMYSVTLAKPGENKALPAGFYESLGKSYDELFYRQEVLGEYLDVAGGSAYHAFSEKNIRMIEYHPGLPLCWALDFNVDPMCSVIAQVEDKATRLDMLTGTRKQNINVLDEICLVDSTTEKACAEFMRRTERWANYRRLVVEVYADASGYSRKTSGKTDIEIIRQAFQHDGRYHLEFRTTKSNPHVRDRVNAVNAALCNSQQERSLFIDPQCKQLRRDLQTVKWKRDMSGNATNDLDKSNPMLTHVSDAAGYLIEKVAGMRPQGGFVGGYQQAGGFIA